MPLYARNPPAMRKIAFPWGKVAPKGPDEGQ